MENNGNRKANYAAISWRNFPTDKTMKAFRTEYQQATKRKKVPSDTWLRGAVNALEDGNGEKVIFSDLFSPRNHDVSLQHSTIPRPIPYETQELLFAIATVRDEDKHLKGDAFAERVFSVLAKKAGQNTVADNYVDMLTLSQFRIQQELLRNFEGLLRQRLELLYNHIFRNTHGIQIDTLKYVLEQIDYLLTGVANNFTEKEYVSAKQDLQDLYTSLLALRKEVVVEEAIKDGSVEKLNWRNKSDSLIKTLNNQLLQTSRSPKPTEISDFLTNYHEYLLRHLGSDIRENASAFLETYRELCDYYFADMDAAQFMEVVQRELGAFSQAIFAELDRMEQVTAVSNYQSKTAAVGYLHLRLTQVQEDILIKIREPMRMLRAVYSLFFFSKKDVDPSAYDENKISGSSKHMKNIVSSLFEECQNELPSVEETLTLEEKVVSAYNYAVSSNHEDGISSEMLWMLLDALSKYPRHSTRYLYATATLLRLMCKVYVSCECKRYSKLLLEEFEQMQKLLSV